MSAAPPPPEGLKLRRHFIATGLLMLLDLFVFGQGAFPMMVAIALVPFGLIGVVRGLFGNRWRLLRGASIIGIYAAMAVIAIMGLRINQSIAASRADRLLAAIEVYRVEQGEYPRDLEQLVPRYVPKIPCAKYSLYSKNFQYQYDPVKKEGYLMYTSIPPFGRRIVELGTKKWSSMD
jgi:hypothetical protein